jgi:hypothetical protein
VPVGAGVVNEVVGPHLVGATRGERTRP